MKEQFIKRGECVKIWDDEVFNTMKLSTFLTICLLLLAVGCSQPANQEAEARQAVQSFYDAFNKHEFENVQNFTTDDWIHINPFGGETVGREAVLKELKEVHESFLKGVTTSIEDMSVRVAAPD